MKKIILLVLNFFLILFTSNSFAETIHFESTSINGEKQKIWINIIKTKVTPAPSILILHDCGGVDNHTTEWADAIASWGYNAIIIDSFSGLVNKVVCKDKSQSSPTIRSSHAHSVATWLSQQDWSTKKIGTVGFSHGGWTVLYLSTDMIRTSYPNSNIVSSVAYYPVCGNFITSQKLKTPIQIHIGELDDWTPAKKCERLEKANQKLKDNIFIYKGAHHSFDRLNVKKYTYIAEGGAKTVESNSDARELSMKRTKEFFEKTLK